jgi:hypothetical protein
MPPDHDRYVTVLETGSLAAPEWDATEAKKVAEATPFHRLGAHPRQAVALRHPDCRSGTIAV